MGAKYECCYCHETFPVEERIDGFNQGHHVGFLCPHGGHLHDRAGREALITSLREQSIP
jgi:hypothetical protein